MKRVDAGILKVFVCGLPVILILALRGSSTGLINAISGLLFGIWMAISVYLGLRLLISTEFRSTILPRLALFQERDERELQMTARATRNSFLVTLALLIFLFCLSVFQIGLYRVPKENAVNGNTGTLTLGINLDFLGGGKAKLREPIAKEFVNYDGLPLSNGAILFSLILWQIGSFTYFMRRSGNESA